MQFLHANILSGALALLLAQSPFSTGPASDPAVPSHGAEREAGDDLRATEAADQRWLAVLEAARASVRRAPQDGSARLRLAELYVERANWSDARAELEQALGLLPGGVDSLRAAHLHARALLAQGLRQRATRALSELSRRPGAPGGALHDLALLLEEDRFHAEALVLEMEALEREPNDPVLLRSAAAFWKANDRLDQAFRMLDRLARSGDADAEDHFQLGLMAHRLGHPDRALEAYAGCLRLDPSHPEACYNQALLLRERGDSEASIASFERVLALRPRYEPTYFELGAYLIDLGRTREAQSVYERYLAAGSDSVALAEAGTILEQLRTGGNPWADPAADSLRRALGIGR